MQSVFKIPPEYVIEYIYKYCKRPHYIKHSNIYNMECPICNEGKSTGKKRRSYYIVDSNYIYCHNCGRSWTPEYWLATISGKSVLDIIKDTRLLFSSQERLFDYNSLFQKENLYYFNKKIQDLPHNSINLFDSIQVNYYKNNRVINDALSLIKTRMMNVAINRPKTFFISLTDYVHKNRLCIPFYDESNKIVFYQTRAIYEKDENIAKYLSKINSDKDIFGINNIDLNLDCLFIFEGPIDAMFIKNGISGAGINFSSYQINRLNKFGLFKKIWVLDNQNIDISARKKSIELLNKGERVFIWPTKYNDCKDINELCVKYNIRQVSPIFIQKNTYNGNAGLFKIRLIK